MDYTKLGFETRQIHAGLDRDNASCSRGTAIYPTAAYRFPTCEYAAGLFELSQPGNIYTRLQNPTTSAYEERVAALYGGSGALAVASGMSAILIAVTSLAEAGDNIVASPYLYGGTYNLFRHTLARSESKSVSPPKPRLKLSVGLSTSAPAVFLLKVWAILPVLFPILKR